MRPRRSATGLHGHLSRRDRQLKAAFCVGMGRGPQQRAVWSVVSRSSPGGGFHVTVAPGITLPSFLSSTRPIRSSPRGQFDPHRRLVRSGRQWQRCEIGREGAVAFRVGHHVVRVSAIGKDEAALAVGHAIWASRDLEEGIDSRLGLSPGQDLNPATGLPVAASAMAVPVIHLAAFSMAANEPAGPAQGCSTPPSGVS